MVISNERIYELYVEANSEANFGSAQDAFTRKLGQATGWGLDGARIVAGRYWEDFKFPCYRPGTYQNSMLRMAAGKLFWNWQTGNWQATKPSVRPPLYALPKAQVAEPTFKPSIPSDEIGALRYRVANHGTAYHEATHGTAALWFDVPLIEIVADGESGYCKYRIDDADLVRARRITCAAVRVTQPEYYFNGAGCSSDRDRYLELLRKSGNRGDTYDLLGSSDAMSDEYSLEEMHNWTAPFIRKLACRLAALGYVSGVGARAMWDGWLRENPRVKEFWEDRRRK